MQFRKRKLILFGRLFWTSDEKMYGNRHPCNLFPYWFKMNWPGNDIIRAKHIRLAEALQTLLRNLLVVALLNYVKLTEAHISAHFLISTFILIFFPLNITIPCGFMLTTCGLFWSVVKLHYSIFHIQYSPHHSQVLFDKLLWTGCLYCVFLWSEFSTSITYTYITIPHIYIYILLWTLWNVLWTAYQIHICENISTNACCRIEQVWNLCCVSGWSASKN